MLKKIFLASIVVLALVDVSLGADVKRLIITCVNRQETTKDDVYVEFVVDDQKVEFGQSGQVGTSRENLKEMKNGDQLVLTEETLKKLAFKNTLRIRVREKDSPASDDTFIDITLKPGENKSKSERQDNAPRKWEYKIEWETTT